jgi:hypothetical protein
LNAAAPVCAIGLLDKRTRFVRVPFCTGAFMRHRKDFQHDGQMTALQTETVRRMLASFSPEIAAARIDLAATDTNRFITASRVRVSNKKDPRRRAT